MRIPLLLLSCINASPAVLTTMKLSYSITVFVASSFGQGFIDDNHHHHHLIRKDITDVFPSKNELSLYAKGDNDVGIGGISGAYLITTINHHRFVRKDTEKPEIELYHKNPTWEKDKTDHVASEILANMIYSDLGVPVPEIRGYVTSQNPKQFTQLSRFLPNSEGIMSFRFSNKTLFAEIVQQAAANFISDAWLANRDIISWDNMRYNSIDKTIYRVDNGGALLHEPTGELKGDFSDQITELFRENEFRKNSVYRSVSMNKTKLIKQIDEFVPKAKAVLMKAKNGDYQIDEVNLFYHPDLLSKLENRLKWLIEWRMKLEPAKHSAISI